ncbi:MAG: NAD(P)-binding domain-containing protein, partial [Planctomycetes bacterium]|nr:NAD(P)-binding domain-containing protein [Planctomycetota bacterium]
PQPARVPVTVGGGDHPEEPPAPRREPLDLLVVGAGPGGIACALAAKEAGIRFGVIDQAADLGGTVASYPRRKLVMTQPIDLPLGVRLDRLSYEKEQLVEMWERVAAEHSLPIRTGTRLEGLDRGDDGVWVARTSRGTVRAHHVCLALGRRGTPRKLGVPGEDLPKVAYSLIDAQSYQGRRILVVGGGDSAIEAAIGLAEQPGNDVTLSYRKHAFFRLKAKNAAKIDAAAAGGQIRLLFESQVKEVRDGEVLIQHDGRVESLPNDEVFVFAGGLAPFGLLEHAGISFDPADRPPVTPLVDQGTGLMRAAIGILACALVLLVWAWAFDDYYAAGPADRVTHDAHDVLAPRGTVGLWAGILACVLFFWNLLYLARRSPWLGRFVRGRLTAWLAIHVFTGLLGWLLIVVHSGMSASNTIGGHAFLALCVVVVTGVVGRYLYSYVPRAANGSEATLEELRSQIAAISGEWDRAGGEFPAAVRDRVEQLVAADRWEGGILRRVRKIVTSRRELRKARRELRAFGLSADVPEHDVERLLSLADQIHDLAFMANHFGDLRAFLSSWRYLHRWLALLMLLLAAAHIVNSVRFGEIDWSVLLGGIGR